MIHRRKKGEYGYRTYRRNVQLGEVAFGAAMILVQLAAREFTSTQAVKNVLTVMAILSVLPTANRGGPHAGGLEVEDAPGDLSPAGHPL